MTMKNNFFDALTKLTFVKLGLQIKINRKHRGMTIAQLANRIKITPKKLRAIERGHIAKVRLDLFVKIARVFDCSVQICFTSTMDQVRRVNQEPEIVSTFTEETS